MDTSALSGNPQNRRKFWIALELLVNCFSQFASCFFQSSNCSFLNCFFELLVNCSFSNCSPIARQLLFGPNCSSIARQLLVNCFFLYCLFFRFLSRDFEAMNQLVAMTKVLRGKLLHFIYYNYEKQKWFCFLNNTKKSILNAYNILFVRHAINNNNNIPNNS